MKIFTFEVKHPPLKIFGYAPASEWLSCCWFDTVLTFIRYFNVWPETRVSVNFSFNIIYNYVYNISFKSHPSYLPDTYKRVPVQGLGGLLTGGLEIFFYVKIVFVLKTLFRRNCNTYIQKNWSLFIERTIIPMLTTTCQQWPPQFYF